MLVKECAAANRRHHHCLPLELCNEMILFASCDTLANLTKLSSSSTPTGGSGDSVAFLAEKQLGKIKIIVRKWSNNKWHIPDQKQVRTSADGLSLTNKTCAWINVRAQHPVSHALLSLIPGQNLVYWEVSMKNGCAYALGWIGPNVPLNDNKWIGLHSGSFAINCCGTYWESGRLVNGYRRGFSVGDMVGSGLLLTRDNRFKIFFTKNGALNGKPIVLEGSQDLLLHPAVSLFWEDASVRANFDMDLAGKPFKFDVIAHETEFFG